MIFAGLLSSLMGIGWVARAAGFFSVWGKLILIGILAALVAYMTWRVVHHFNEDERIRAENVELRATSEARRLRIREDHAQLVKQQKATEACIAANDWNALQAAQERTAKEAAEGRVAVLEALGKNRREDINRESTQFRTTAGECRTLTDPLPRDFREWVRH